MSTKTQGNMRKRQTPRGLVLAAGVMMALGLIFSPVEVSAAEPTETEPAELVTVPTEIQLFKQTYEYTPSDLVEMAKLVYVEAGNQCFDGKVAVAAVVLNRVYESKSTVHDVIHAPGQFASISGAPDWVTADDSECMEAVKQAIAGVDPTASIDGGALFFCASWATGYVNYLEGRGVKLLTIDGQVFRRVYE